MAIQKPRRRNTVSQAKNLMRRAVAEIVDPSPTDVGPVWDYFENHCAYCGAAIKRAARIGHIDHATPGGGNHLGNLVLACPRCNGDAKRDEPWRDFLQRTVQDEQEASQRAARIIAWAALHPRNEPRRSGEVARVLAEVEHLINDFAFKCEELRQCVRR